jgi:hypothetical protein
MYNNPWYIPQGSSVDHSDIAWDITQGHMSVDGHGFFEHDPRIVLLVQPLAV